MSTLGWIALVLAALAAVIAFWAARGRSRSSEAHNPRTVADLVRLRAEQAEAAAPVPVPAPVLAEPVAAEPDGEVPATNGAPVLAAPARERRVASVPASADDTPWNRAARIAESDGVVWATDHEWAGWADWAEAESEESVAPEPERPAPVLRPVVLPAFPPDLVDTRTAAPPPDPVAEPVVEEPVRARPAPAEATAEQAAADLALLRTFGGVPAAEPDEPPAVSLEGVSAPAPLGTRDGAAQPVEFRVVGRDGAGVAGAGVTLLDDRGREAAQAVADVAGAGTVLAPGPGSYVLVSAAADHQPGAVAITVAGEPVSADLLLARSASLSGTVHSERGAVIGARLTLVQDGEIVDSAESGPDGGYRIGDLAAGEYGLSVTAVECEPATVTVTVPDETDLRHDVELDPVGLSIGQG